MVTCGRTAEKEIKSLHGMIFLCRKILCTGVKETFVYLHLHQKFASSIAFAFEFLDTCCGGCCIIFHTTERTTPLVSWIQRLLAYWDLTRSLFCRVSDYLYYLFLIHAKNIQRRITIKPVMLGIDNLCAWIVTNGLFSGAQQVLKHTE